MLALSTATVLLLKFGCLTCCLDIEFGTCLSTFTQKPMCSPTEGVHSIWRTKWNSIAFNVFNAEKRVVDNGKMRHAYMGWWNATSLCSLEQFFFLLVRVKMCESEPHQIEMTRERERRTKQGHSERCSHYTLHQRQLAATIQPLIHYVCLFFLACLFFLVVSFLVRYFLCGVWFFFSPFVLFHTFTRCLLFCPLYPLYPFKLGGKEAISNNRGKALLSKIHRQATIYSRRFIT